MSGSRPGSELRADQTYAVTRADLVRYAGASGDFNPIHWSDRVATSVGLPGVIAHGMFTLALAGRAVADWAGGPSAVETFGARSPSRSSSPTTTRATVVEVGRRRSSASTDGRRRSTSTVTCDGQKVLGMPPGGRAGD